MQILIRMELPEKSKRLGLYGLSPTCGNVYIKRKDVLILTGMYIDITLLRIFLFSLAWKEIFSGWI